MRVLLAWRRQGGGDIPGYSGSSWWANVLIGKGVHAIVFHAFEKMNNKNDFILNGD
jgi:hypothetical protein